MSFLIRFLSVILLLLLGCKRGNESEGSKRPFRLGASLSDQEQMAEDGISQNSWPNLFGPNRQSQIHDSRLPDRLGKPVEEWRIDVGSGYSSPVLQNDHLFIAHRKGSLEIVECFSATDGKSLWSHSFPAPYECPYEYSDGPYSTPVLFENRMIVVGQAGYSCCLDQADGKLIWERNLFQDFGMKLGEWPVAASGIVVGNRFLFNLGAVEQKAGIIALDVSNGETVWQSTQHEAGHATPNVMINNGKTYVIMVTSNGLVSVDPENGDECWFIPFRRKKADTYNAVSPGVFGKRACMVTGPGPGTLLVEVDAANQPTVLWNDRRILDSQYTNLVCVDGFLFGFTSMKQGGPELRCIDLVAHKLNWKWKAKLGRAMLLACNETIIILGEKGHLAGVVLSPEGSEPLFRTEKPVLKGPCYSAPALHNGRLFLRNEQHVVCLKFAL